MKIDSLLENQTPSSAVSNTTSSAPKFGRDPKVLEDEKLDETTAGATGSGSVATVAQPLGQVQKRNGKGSIFQGVRTSKKFANSVSVSEAVSPEQFLASFKKKEEFRKKIIDSLTASTDGIDLFKKYGLSNITSSISFLMKYPEIEKMPMPQILDLIRKDLEGGLQASQGKLNEREVDEANINQQLALYHPETSSYRGAKNPIPQSDTAHISDITKNFKRADKYSHQDLTFDKPGVSQQDDVELNTEREQLKKIFAGIIDQLPENLQKFIKMRYYNDMDIKEIAAYLKVTPVRVVHIENQLLRMLKGNKFKEVFKKAGLSEGFSSKQELINYFVKQGKSPAMASAAWERGYRGSSQPKSQSTKTPVQQNKPQKSYWWQDKELEENLHQWFKEKWVRFGPDGKIRGDCARGDDSEGKPKCLPQAKAHSLGKKGRKYAAAKKRREDPNPERRGPAKNVATKKKSNESVTEGLLGDTYRKLKSMVLKVLGKKTGVSQNDTQAFQRMMSKVTAPVDSSQYARLWQEYKKDPNFYVSLPTLQDLENDQKIYLWANSISQFIMNKFPDASKEALHQAVLGLTNYAIREFKQNNDQGVAEEQLDELKCWPGYTRVRGVPAGAPGSCKKKTNEQELEEKWSQKYKDSINCSNPKGFSQKAHCAGKKKNEDIQEEKCPYCGGPMFSEMIMNEKKDACYYKVKSRYKVWPSAYASGALVKCRKKGASNWGNKSESIDETEFAPMKMQDYLDKAEELHSRMMKASQNRDVEEFERIKKEREQLDKQARQGMVHEASRFQNRERTAGEGEPEGWFDVLAKTKTGWKELGSKRSNQAFYYARNLAEKYPDRTFAVRWPNGTINIIKPFKLDESEISEDMVAQKLARELDALLGRSPSKELGDRPQDKEIGDKPKDKEIVAKENITDALIRKKSYSVYRLLSTEHGDIVRRYGHEIVGDAIYNVVERNLMKDTQELANLVLINLQRNLQQDSEES